MAPSPQGPDPRSDLPGTFGQRTLARAIDLMIVSSVILLLGGATVTTDDGEPQIPRWVWLVFAIVYVGYEAGLMSRSAGTVGKRSTRIAVVSARTGARPAVIQAVVRALVPFTGWLIVPGLGPLLLVLVYLTAAADLGFRRGIPDRLAGTVVVQRPAVADVVS